MSKFQIIFISRSVFIFIVLHNYFLSFVYNFLAYVQIFGSLVGTSFVISILLRIVRNVPFWWFKMKFSAVAYSLGSLEIPMVELSGTWSLQSRCFKLLQKYVVGIFSGMPLSQDRV